MNGGEGVAGRRRRAGGEGEEGERGRGMGPHVNDVELVSDITLPNYVLSVRNIHLQGGELR